jgi:hypothetical protein
LANIFATVSFNCTKRLGFPIFQNKTQIVNRNFKWAIKAKIFKKVELHFWEKNFDQDVSKREQKENLVSSLTLVTLVKMCRVAKENGVTKHIKSTILKTNTKC